MSRAAVVRAVATAVTKTDFIFGKLQRLLAEQDANKKLIKIVKITRKTHVIFNALKWLFIYL